MAFGQNSQDILRTVWSWFREIAKYLAVYLIIYAAVKFLVQELLAIGNEGVYALVALILTLLVYFFVQRKNANSADNST